MITAMHFCHVVIIAASSCLLTVIPLYPSPGTTVSFTSFLGAAAECLGKPAPLLCPGTQLVGLVHGL